jgi:hypothetical protein
VEDSCDVNAPNAARLVERHLRKMLGSYDTQLSVLVVFGAARNGVRSLIRERIPQMVQGWAALEA